MRSPDGTITTFNVPGAGTGAAKAPMLGASTQRGWSCAYLDPTNVYHGYLRSPDGTITTFDILGAGRARTRYQSESVNYQGTIAGNYFDANGVSHGFMRAKRGPSERSTSLAPVLALSKVPSLFATIRQGRSPDGRLTLAVCFTASCESMQTTASSKPVPEEGRTRSLVQSC